MVFKIHYVYHAWAVCGFTSLHTSVLLLLQMARTQRNKATAKHLGILKARLAKLRQELITPKGGGGTTGEGVSVIQ